MKYSLFILILSQTLFGCGKNQGKQGQKSDQAQTCSQNANELAELRTISLSELASFVSNQEQAECLDLKLNLHCTADGLCNVSSKDKK